MTNLNEILEAGKVIPVLAFTGLDEALLTCRTLYDAGLRVFEITLRHETALEVIRAVIADLPGDAYVGVGTVMTPALLQAAIDTGASFGVSPGLTPELAEAVRKSGWAFLPGVSTVSEAMVARSAGFSVLKFFPAEASGGVDFLKSAKAVLNDIKFCPTGGIKPANAGAYLSLDNVPVVGGSWMVVRDGNGLIDQKKTRDKTLEIRHI